MTKPNDRLLLKANLKQLRLPTIGAEFEKLAREATASNQTFEQYLLRLTELEVATRQSNALTSRIRQADFPVEKDLETFDFLSPFHGEQAEGSGTGAMRMDRTAVQYLSAGSAGNGQDALGCCLGELGSPSWS